MNEKVAENNGPMQEAEGLTSAVPESAKPVGVLCHLKGDLYKVKNPNPCTVLLPHIAQSFILFYAYSCVHSFSFYFFICTLLDY